MLYLERKIYTSLVKKIAWSSTPQFLIVSSTSWKLIKHFSTASIISLSNPTKQLLSNRPLSNSCCWAFLIYLLIFWKYSSLCFPLTNKVISSLLFCNDIYITIINQFKEKLLLSFMIVCVSRALTVSKLRILLWIWIRKWFFYFLHLLIMVLYS